MHLLSSMPGGWTEEEGVIYMQQSPGDLVFLSSADTDLWTMHQAYVAWSAAEKNLPVLRMCHLNYLRQELSLDNYIEDVLGKAKCILLRVLGGETHYPYLVQQLRQLAEETDIHIIWVSAHIPDLSLMSLSSVSWDEVYKCREYLEEGGVENYRSLLSYLGLCYFEKKGSIRDLFRVEDIFLYEKGGKICPYGKAGLEGIDALIFAYRSYYLSGHTAWLEVLLESLETEDIVGRVLFVHHLREKTSLDQIRGVLKGTRVQVLITSTGFATKALQDVSTPFWLESLGLPVIQGIVSSASQSAWEEMSMGLFPMDLAMHIALPEVDGRIIGPSVSFKESRPRSSLTESDLVDYVGYLPAASQVAKMARGWKRLQEKPNSTKRIAVLLPNYPNKEGRLANGVGLDTPESCLRILRAMHGAGYSVDLEGLEDVDKLMRSLTSRVTNDLDTLFSRPYEISISWADFQSSYQKLSLSLRERVEGQWGLPESSPYFSSEAGFVLPGFLSGDTFIGIQPARGYHEDPKAIYHSPDLPPPYAYLAYYFWIQDVYDADAILHVGKHGNLEWLPGKSLSLSEGTCFPAAICPNIPHFYPFIVNDPGEGTQAKRRTHAVIIDHLIPPMTRAESYGDLEKLEGLLEEYYEAFLLDKPRAIQLKQEIEKLARSSDLEHDLGRMTDLDDWLFRLDTYICELKEAQIRGGLHILGQAPETKDEVDLWIALHRLPTRGVPSLIQTLAEALGLQEDVLNRDPGDILDRDILGKRCRKYGQLQGLLEEELKERLGHPGESRPYDTEKLIRVFEHVRVETGNKLKQTSQEIDHLLEGLEGKYIASGPSGAPTRGQLDTLPTGRNFYSVDIRTVPTPTAFRLGQKSAEGVVSRYIQEHGVYPETLGLSVWGTSTMRTGGDDIAQALALVGAEPVWDEGSRRVLSFRILSIEDLGRPRVDVMLRISGFFRDAFPDLITGFQRCVEEIALREGESLEENPLRKRYLEEKAYWESQNISKVQSHKRASYRVFGSKPEAYGTGLQALIDQKNWTTSEDLARVYVQWGAYAYGSEDGTAVSVPECFQTRLRHMQIVLHNQDNREHDILDSDDYYQFQGGMANAVRHEAGQMPDMYFGDHSRPERPKIKLLQEELLKVYRSRVINPKWIQAMRKHSYKGGFEMAATLDYLFAYDVTTSLVHDFMYEGLSQAYLHDAENQSFLRKHNPWALREMSERLLEAIHRGLWSKPSPEQVAALQELYLEMEAYTQEGETNPPS
ncbi:MAG: cobaltochelatase subunit CobN [Cytophagales bacterium]|nr:cobaltochelatase subunit CobN [Cytophagales bacterium]